MALFQYFKKVDGNYPGTNLPDPQGAFLKEVPSSSTSAANTEIAAVLQPLAAGVKGVRGMYLKENFNGTCPMVWLDLMMATAKASLGLVGSLAHISSSPIDASQISL